MAEIIEAMGFTHVGPHRSKPVQLWRQGHAQILLNHGDRTGEEDALVSALGIDCSDPDGAAARAEALGAPLLPRTRGPREADLVSIGAPDQTSVLFCHTADDRRDAWVDDFVELDEAAGDSCGITAVDHIVLSQPFDYFDEAVLFYRSVLGLAPCPSEDLAAPEGLLVSRALEAPGEGVRLAITVPRLGGGGRLAELQHVAFASEDLMETALRLRERGVPLLPVPDNYYEDLEARTELAPDRVEALRDRGVLYDSDGDGELLQVFTGLLGGRLFFEVVQRTGGYGGYGSVNTPVRLAAQLRPAVEGRPA